MFMNMKFCLFFFNKIILSVYSKEVDMFSYNIYNVINNVLDNIVIKEESNV